MTYRIVPRPEISLDPVVRNSDGSPRAGLSGERWLTLHWTGVGVAYGDLGDTPAEIRGIESAAARAGKPNEYNYVIGQDPDDIVYEYAGTFAAAHSAGENSDSVGVLFLNGTGEPVTALQIDKARWLRDVLRYFGVLRPDPEVTPHRSMPGAATQCPGPAITAAAPIIAQPWQAPTPPPPPPPVVPPTTSTGAGLLAMVQTGEGWYTIARRTMAGDIGANVARLQSANPGTVLRPGALVNVPGLAS